MGERKLDLTVACFLWGQWCNSHAINYVNRLFAGVNRHLNIPHRFVCFTDRTGEGFDPEIEIIPLSVDEVALRWNLTKMVAYKFGNGLTGRVLLFDLDVVIVGNLDELASYDGQFITCEAAYHKNGIGGSLIGFEAGWGNEELWVPLTIEDRKVFCENMTDGSERQYFIMQLWSKGYKIDFWQKLYPDQVLSYKVHCRDIKTIPDNARVIRFHGKPRPHEVKEHWIKEHWI